MDASVFDSGRSRRFGTANPTRMDVTFWHHMVRTGEAAYVPRREFDSEWHIQEPVWCFDRFGPTRTALPDGRVVCIGGEHEDFYDPDFCIYNDVIVVGPGGGEVEIFGYPRELFLPIDFHTATLCGDRIIIAGGLGYHGERGGDDTPVFSLDLDTFAISRLVTTDSSPGWVYGHQADLTDSGQALRVWGGRLVRGRGKGEKRVIYDGAAGLDLRTLTWQPVPVPPADSLPDVDLPYPWEAIAPRQADYEMNLLRKEVPLGHPLFAANVRPIAEHGEQVLMRVLDGTGRVAVVTLAGTDRHATLPEPLTAFYADIHAAVAALGEEHAGR